MTRQIGIPCYATGVHSIAGATDRIVATQVPATCDGVMVNPGEIVFGDDDGILVANYEQFSQLIPLAEQIQASEERLIGKMEKALSLLDMLNFDEHCSSREMGKPSKVQFHV